MDFVELEERARRVLEPSAYDYFAGGADDELTLNDNPKAWTRLRLRPHVLRDVSTVSTAATVLGSNVSMPVLVAPMAYHRMAHDEGEKATTRAAGRAGVINVVSTLATCSAEEIAEAAPDTLRWFQLYVHKDRGWTEDLVARVAASGYRALVLTVDLPYAGNRRRDVRNNFRLHDRLQMANPGRSTPQVDGSGLAAYVAEEIEPNLTPGDIEWLRGLSDLPVLVKGVLRGDDARMAIDAGASAVIVSNHGGRQLDTAVATADALPEVVAAVGDDVEVLVDGGVRRGTDIVKALALGARAVLVGRPLLWGLATGGEDGVVAVLETLRTELTLALALCGASSVDDVTRDLVV